MALAVETELENEAEEGGDVEETIQKVEADCSQVLDGETTGPLLEGIFELARANYDKDPSGWESLLTEMKGELMYLEDEAEQVQILQNKERKAKAELI